eukprot:ANDGO_00471.mRNA.1 putative phosphomevalonate kinase
MKLVCSCPGKVLLLGGYLVLDAENTGLVATTSARFYATIEPSASPSAHPPPDGMLNHRMTLVIESPQFSMSIRSDVHMSSSTHRISMNPSFADTNPFIHHAVHAVIHQISHEFQSDDIVRGLHGRTLRICLEADNDFYSMRQQLMLRGLKYSPDGLRALPPRIRPLSFPEDEFSSPHIMETYQHRLKGESLKISKTGLGSSAALTASLTAALYLYLHRLCASVGESAAAGDDAHSELSHDVLEKVHTLAQCAHSLAQGKIGSGFDVAAAVFGPHLYTRFSPSLLDFPAGSLPYPLPTLDCKIRPFQWPDNVDLMLGDVATGSHTPSMVASVLQYRKQQEESAGAVWSELSTANRDAIEVFLGRANDAAHASDVLQKFHAVRRCMKALGVAADVPIEPDEQTCVLNQVEERVGREMHALLGVGVPGAGGYDAVFALVRTDVDGSAPEKEVEMIWSNHGICAMTLRRSADGLQANWSL